jgi:hypothetical protein
MGKSQENLVPEDLEPDEEERPERNRHGHGIRKKRSREEQEEIIAFAAALLSQNPTHSKREIKKLLRNRYAASNFSARTLESYLSRAREKLRDWSYLPAQTVRERMNAMLQGMLRMSLKVEERLRVLDRLIQIYGLAQAPVVVTGKDAGPIQYENMTDKQLARIAAEGLPAAESRTGGPVA